MITSIEGDAEATIKFAIFSAISDNYHKNNPTLLRDKIFERIFEPHLKWAIEEYIKILPK